MRKMEKYTKSVIKTKFSQEEKLKTKANWYVLEREAVSTDLLKNGRLKVYKKRRKKRRVPIRSWTKTMPWVMGDWERKSINKNIM